MSHLSYEPYFGSNSKDFLRITRTVSKHMNYKNIWIIIILYELLYYMNYKTTFDNYYATSDFMAYFKTEGIIDFGTVRWNHMSNCILSRTKKEGTLKLDVK